MTIVKVNNRPAVKNWNGIVNDLFRDFEASLQPAIEKNSGKPLTNVAETKDGFHVEILAPGRNKSLFELKVENGELLVSYQIETIEANQEIKSLRNEFTLGSFKRSFSIDENMNIEGIQAKYEDGLLKLYIPKKENELPVSQTIQIK